MKRFLALLLFAFFAPQAAAWHYTPSCMGSGNWEFAAMADHLPMHLSGCLVLAPHEHVQVFDADALARPSIIIMESFDKPPADAFVRLSGGKLLARKQWGTHGEWLERTTAHWSANAVAGFKALGWSVPGGYLFLNLYDDPSGRWFIYIARLKEGNTSGMLPTSPSTQAHPAPAPTPASPATPRPPIPTPPPAARAKPPTPAPPPIPYSETRERPLAVLLNNTKGYPQAGLRTASAIYEMPVEGGFTRLMSVYDRTDPDQVGPIGSARPYFVDLVESMKGILVHDGGSPAAMAQMERIKLPDFDAGGAGQLFTRKGAGYAPYNFYADGATLRQVTSRLGLERSASVGGDIFQPPGSAKDASSILVAYSKAYKSSFVYLPKVNQYRWQRNGTPAVDASGEAVLVDAVVVAHITAQPLPNDPEGRLYIPIRGGEATLYIHGKQVAGHWSDQGGFSFSSSDKTIDLTPFKFWVLFVPQWAAASPQ